MNKLVKCLNKYRKRQATFVSLQEALVSNRIANYGFFRFRFAALSTLLSLGAHILEFLILSSVFSFGDFSALFLLRTIAIFCRSSWWGMLEVLRARIRVLYADRELLEIRQAIVHWMLLAGSISLLICIIAMGLYFFIPKVSMASTIFKLYFLVILIEIAIQLLVSTFHAGLYAVKRIPRPFLSIAVTDILAVIFVLLLPDEERVYTLPVSLLFSSILSGGLSAYYTARAYRDVNFFPWLWPTVQTFYYFLKSIRHKELVFAGLASTMFSMDVVILNVLIMTHVSTKDTYKIVIILYLLAPLIRSTANWTSLFYFDLKYTVAPALILFRQAFKKRLLLFAINIGLVSWLLSIMVIFWIHPAYPLLAGLLLLILLVLISCVHYLQMRVFCEKGYFNVIVSGCFTLAVFSFTALTTTQLLYLFAAIFGCFVISLLFFLTAPLYFRLPHQYALDAVGKCEWLSKLSLKKGHVNVLKLHLTLPRAVKENARLAKMIAVYSGPGGGSCYEKNTPAIYCYTPELLSNEWLIYHGFGLVNRLTELTYNELVDDFSSTDRLPNRTIGDISVMYSQSIQHGIVIIPGQHSVVLDKINRDVIRKLLDRSCAFIQKGNHMVEGYSIEAYYQEGAIHALFITPLNKNPMIQLEQWWNILYKLNLRNP